MAQANTDVSQFVSLNPESHITFAQGTQKTDLIISNRSSTKNVCFKIRTTMPMLFVVKPISGIIEAGKDAKIEINYVQIDVSSTRRETQTHFDCVAAAGETWQPIRCQVPSPSCLHRLEE